MLNGIFGARILGISRAFIVEDCVIHNTLRGRLSDVAIRHIAFLQAALDTVEHTLATFIVRVAFIFVNDAMLESFHSLTKTIRILGQYRIVLHRLFHIIRESLTFFSFLIRNDTSILRRHRTETCASKRVNRIILSILVGITVSLTIMESSRAVQFVSNAFRIARNQATNLIDELNQSSIRLTFIGITHLFESLQRIIDGLHRSRVSTGVAYIRTESRNFVISFLNVRSSRAEQLFTEDGHKVGNRRHIVVRISIFTTGQSIVARILIGLSNIDDSASQFDFIRLNRARLDCANHRLYANGLIVVIRQHFLQGTQRLVDGFDATFHIPHGGLLGFI